VAARTNRATQAARRSRRRWDNLLELVMLAPNQSKTRILWPWVCGPWSALPRPERLGLTMK
jgi:hypothetical protein